MRGRWARACGVVCEGGCGTYAEQAALKHAALAQGGHAQNNK